MSEIKLLALDLDGTLFTKDKQVTAENRAALKAAEAKGVHVVITTGRPLPAITHILEDLGLLDDKHYSVTFNGGLVQRNNGDILIKKEMSREDLKKIYAVFEPLGLPMDVISDGIVYGVPSKGNHSLYRQANPTLTFVDVESIDDIPENIVYNKVVTVCEEAFLDAQIQKIPDHLYQAFEVFKSREIILEVMPKGVHKAVGLRLLTDYLALDKGQVMAMGDEENDLTMLEWSGFGVAMANAVPKVKAVAKAVTTKTNEESGVAEAIHKYILEK